MENDIQFNVLTGEDGDIGKIILNRPQNLNALTLEMCYQLKIHLEKWGRQENIKAVLITSSADKAFCAGGDIVSMYLTCRREKNSLNGFKFFQTEYAMNKAIFDFPKPYISFLNGITMGGGVGISIHGSHSVATERLVWAMPETGIGFFPDVGAGYHLARLPDFIGYFLGLTGEKVNAEQAYQLKIVDAIVPSAKLQELESDLVSTKFLPNKFDSVTRIINQFHQPSQLTRHLNASVIAEIFNNDSIELIIESLKKFSDPWAEATAQILLKKSPLSLKVTHRHLQHCVRLEFGEIMHENLHLAGKFVESHDFMEGIRAAVIDKDKKPNWEPETLDVVSDSMVDTFFN